MRKTKIICTIGPASESESVLTQMCKAGMNVARLNFSHGSHEEHQKKIDTIKKVRKALGLPIAIMLDTKGPEYRIKTFENGKITLKDGDTFTLTTDDIVGNQERVSVTYKNLINNLKVGDHVLINNGLIILEVEKLKAPDAICKVLVGGEVSDKKSMNFPNKVMDHAFLSEQDKKDLLFGIKNDVDFVAASFVSVKKDVEDMRKFLDENGGEDIDIIAKIENRSGVEHIEEICEIANGVMIARGDLGVEIPGMEVPAVQKYLISKCRMLGKRVITATEMLESMIHNPRPTRAELSDVANAVYDGSSAIMLSGESAAGKYPVDAVRNMAEIAEYTESQIKYTKRFRTSDFETRSIQDAISHATCAMAVDVQAKCIVASTLSGTTARMVSRFRCPVDIIGMTTSEKVWRKLNLSWGVTPVLCEEFSSMEVMFYHAMKKAKEYLADESYLWNSGMFVWKISTILNNMKEFMPKTYEGLVKIQDAIGTEEQESVLEAEFEKMDSESIDYGIMEKAENIFVLPGTFGWDDVGSWLAVGRIRSTNEFGNAVQGNVITVETKNSIIEGSDKLIAAVGLEDIIVVDTEDALLICDKGHAGDIKKVLENLRICNRNEYI